MAQAYPRHAELPVVDVPMPRKIPNARLVRRGQEQFNDLKMSNYGLLSKVKLFTPGGKILSRWGRKLSQEQGCLMEQHSNSPNVHSKHPGRTSPCGSFHLINLLKAQKQCKTNNMKDNNNKKNSTQFRKIWSRNTRTNLKMWKCLKSTEIKKTMNKNQMTKLGLGLWLHFCSGVKRWRLVAVVINPTVINATFPIFSAAESQFVHSDHYKCNLFLISKW